MDVPPNDGGYFTQVNQVHVVRSSDGDAFVQINVFATTACN